MPKREMLPGRDWNGQGRQVGLPLQFVKFVKFVSQSVMVRFYGK